jgi:hypothetical protein
MIAALPHPEKDLRSTHQAEELVTPRALVALGAVYLLAVFIGCGIIRAVHLRACSSSSSLNSKWS